MNFPVIVKELKYTHLFGLVRIEYLVENRRPDLPDTNQRVCKYKHHINLRIFFRKYNWTLRSQSPYSELPYIDVGDRTKSN